MIRRTPYYMDNQTTPLFASLILYVSVNYILLDSTFWVLNRSLCVCVFPFPFWIKSCLDASPRIGEEGVAPFDLCNRRLQVVFLPLLEFNVPLQTIPSEEVSLIQYIDKTSPLGSFAVSTHRSMLSHV